MNLAKILPTRPALITVAAVFVAGASVAQPANQPAAQPGMQRMRPPISMLPDARSNYGFFPANQPASSNRVGVFVARRGGGTTSLYYCSMPADPGANGSSVCKQVKGFPSD